MRRFLFALFLLVAASGCGDGRHPVTGRVVYEDGGAVEGGTVIAEATVNGKAVGIQGNIGPDGSFTMGASKAGDGALPGSYRVLVMPVALGDSEQSEGKQPTVSGKYSSYGTSGLTAEVKAEKNVLTLTAIRRTWCGGRSAGRCAARVRSASRSWGKFWKTGQRRGWSQSTNGKTHERRGRRASITSCTSATRSRPSGRLS